MFKRGTNEPSFIYTIIAMQRSWLMLEILFIILRNTAICSFMYERSGRFSEGEPVKKSPISKIQTCEIQNLDTEFVGSLFRNQENAII